MVEKGPCPLGDGFTVYRLGREDIKSSTDEEFIIWWEYLLCVRPEDIAIVEEAISRELGLTIEATTNQDICEEREEVPLFKFCLERRGF
jgi:hypothetical protein